jgi:putative tricarboxylic transport membrane protein
MDSHLGIDAVTESSRLEFRPEILDLIIAAALGGLALAFWHGAAAFDEGDASGVGPATFPRGLALLLGVVALILALRAAVGLARFQPQATASIERPLAVALGIVLVALFPLLMSSLGYYLATTVWLPLLLFVAGYRKPIGILVYTAGFLAFVKLGFDMILRTPLP